MDFEVEEISALPLCYPLYIQMLTACVGENPFFKKICELCMILIYILYVNRGDHGLGCSFFFKAFDFESRLLPCL